ncbi:MAG: hypothetical protein ACI8RD_008690, partial [Bacillariaceae sp.]|jgi:hypothetical protein
VVLYAIVCRQCTLALIDVAHYTSLIKSTISHETKAIRQIPATDTDTVGHTGHTSCITSHHITSHHNHIMVKGRPGFYLEAWKFGVYISIPVFASFYFSDPETIKKQADYWKFIEYPENPNTNVKQKIQEIAKEKEKQKEQRLAYQRQLQELNRAAQRSSSSSSSSYDDESGVLPENGKSWWRRLLG